MAEYIDKNKILDRLDRLMHIATEPPMDADDKAQWVLLRELHKEFSEMPAEDIEHGEWIECSNQLNKYCSSCKRIRGTIYTKEPFCEMCGAKMDGGKMQ